VYRLYAAIRFLKERGKGFEEPFWSISGGTAAASKGLIMKYQRGLDYDYKCWCKDGCICQEVRTGIIFTLKFGDNLDVKIKEIREGEHYEKIC
jgi:hypothetical protein